MKCVRAIVLQEEEDESKYYLIEKINEMLIFWYSFELQCIAKDGSAL